MKKTIKIFSIILMLELITSVMFCTQGAEFTTISNNVYNTTKNSNLNNISNLSNNSLTGIVQYDNSELNYLDEDYYDYYIQSYNVDVNVSEDNIYSIKETISAYFTEEKHGISRSIPLSNTVKRTDGTISTNRAKITNIKVNEEYTINRNSENITIKIGNKNKTITGKHTYEISYDYNIGNDKLTGSDEFYYNIIGTKWDTYINSFSFNIRMPKEFDTTKIGFSIGRYGTSGVINDNNLKYSVDGNVISGEYNKKLSPYEGFTIRISLPEGYFLEQKIKLTYYDILVIILPICFAIMSFIIWNKNGKDEKPTEVVEFTPPDNFNSLDIAFLYKGRADGKDVVSLLIYLANKGYIKIQEYEENGIFKIKSYKIYKLKEYDGNNKLEAMFLNGLFRHAKKYDNINNNTYIYVTKSDLEDRFYTTIRDITSEENCKENRQKIYEKGMAKRTLPLLILVILNIFVMAISLIKCGVVMQDIKPFLCLNIFATLIYYLLLVNTIELSLNSSGGIITIVFLKYLLPIFFIFATSIYVFQFLDGLGMIECTIQFISIAIIFVFMSLMEKRNEYGTKILGRIKGFRNFLQTAEKEKLEMLVNENPQYFYNILPYAYVLGVSSEWMKKFETIITAPPDWYDSYDNRAFNYYVFTRSFDNLMSSSLSAMTSYPSSSGSSGIGGGGGFSGGGSGGGGGSSW